MDIVDASSKLALFALGSSVSLGKKIAHCMHRDLDAHEEREFDDGEHKARPLVTVRGRDVYVLHSLFDEPGQSVNDKLCRLLFFAGAVRDAGAARVTAVIPYLAYARKDQRSKPRDPVTTRYVACMFEAVGVDRVLTLDVHNLAAFENAFRCRVEHLHAAGILLRAVLPCMDVENPCVLAPDIGAVKRAEHFRTLLSQASGRPAGLAFMEKYRSEGKLSGEAMAGDTAGREVIIVDDLINSGSTVLRAASAAAAQGAKRIHVIATHAVFMPSAARLFDAPGIANVIVTDSVLPWRLNGKPLDKLKIIDCAPLLAEAVLRLHRDVSFVGMEGY